MPMNAYPQTLWAYLYLTQDVRYITKLIYSFVTSADADNESHFSGYELRWRAVK